MAIQATTLVCKLRPRSRQALAVLSLAGITLCKIVVFLIFLQSGYVQPYLGGGAQAYFLPAANDIRITGTFNDPETTFSRSKVAPGYPVFLALAEWVGGGWYLSLVVCLQMLLDYSTALFLLYLGDQQTSIEAGWLAGALWLVFPPAVVISTWIASETLFTTLLALSIVMLMRSLPQQSGMRLPFAAGLVLGVATLVRGTTQLLPVFFFAITLFSGIPRRVFKCALFLIGMCLLVFPWTLRNLYVFGEPIIVQRGIGPVFLMGSRSEYFTIDGLSSSLPALRRQAVEEGLEELTVRSEDRWYLKLGLREYTMRLKQQPLSFFPLLMHKFARLWYGMETGIYYKQFILGLCSLLTVPMGILQIYLWRKEHFPLSLLLALLIVYFVTLYLVTLPLFRYVIPLYPFIVFAASHQYLKFFKLTRFAHAYSAAHAQT